MKWEVVNLREHPQQHSLFDDLPDAQLEELAADMEANGQRWGPAWRWCKAQWLVAQRQHISRVRDDSPTIEAVRFVRLLARCEQEGHWSRAEEEMPAFAQAHTVYLSRGRQRLELEARLLARQDDHEIAEAMGLSPAVVAIYEGLFFAVRDCLQAAKFIIFRAIGLPGAAEGGPRIDVLLKLSAFQHGPAVLDAWLRYLDRLANPSSAPLDLRTPAGRAVAAVELLVAETRLPANEPTGLQLLKVFPLLARIAKDRPAMRPASMVFSEQAAHALGDLSSVAVEILGKEEQCERRPGCAGELRGAA